MHSWWYKLTVDECMILISWSVLYVSFLNGLFPLMSSKFWRYWFCQWCIRFYTSASAAVWALSSLQNIASGKTLKLIYYALVHSKMNYCLSVWGGVSTSRINPITIIQKRALRVICKVPYLTHTETLFKDQSILKIADMYKLQIACIISKHTHGLWRWNCNQQSQPHTQPQYSSCKS